MVDEVSGPTAANGDLMSGPVPSPFPSPHVRRRKNLGGWRTRDGRKWRIGTGTEVAWIANGTSAGRTITAAIPPVFEAYATVVLPYAGVRRELTRWFDLCLLGGSG